MTKVDGSISSLIQGVSQQPARERLPGQGELQENCTSDPVNGLARRGPSEFVAQLFSSADSYRFTDYDAGSLGHFEIAHKDEEIRVFNLDGTENTVTVDGTADTYIPDGELKFIGIDENIYIVDPEKTTAMLSGARTYVEDGSLVFWLGGQYGRDYEITLDWTDSLDVDYSETESYTTPDGSSASHISNIATDYLATQLYNDLTGNTNVNTNFDVSIESDVIFIRKKDAADVVSYEVKVSDGDGGANMFAVNGKVDDVGDLPRFAPHNYVVTVSESSSAEADDWYLEFLVDESDGLSAGDGFGSNGGWVETVAPGLDYQLDPATMPHVLEKTGPTAFTLKQAEWDDRSVGDDTTNPVPSFVGNSINDIGSFQGRLALTSDVNLILSRTNKHTNFFNQSATTLADNDPIDISSALGTFVLKTLVPHNRDLVVFSDKAQFILFGRNAITPKNSSLVLTTEFEADLSSDPVGAGRNVFFAFKYGNYTGIQEFFTDGSQDINDSRPITQHVSKYIEGVATSLVSTTNFNKLIVPSDNDPKVIYVYEYIWVDQRKVQTSWSTWKFDFDIEHMFFVDNLLYITHKDGNSYELYTLDLDDTADDGTGYRVMLDQKVPRTSVNTTFSAPYAVDDIDNYVVVQGEGCPNPGMRVLVDSYSDPVVTLKKDMEGGTVYFGRKYMSKYQPTTPFVRDENNVKVGSGVLTIKQFVVHFADTGYFDALITDDYGYVATVSYNGRVLGSPTNTIGEPAVADGSFRVPYKKNVESSQLEIRSDSHLPMYLTEMEWIGQWKKKGRRITGG